MTVGPDTTTDIYNQIVERLTDPNKFPNLAINQLTNFVEGSFNQVWIETFASGLREAQVRATAAQLSGWIDYAGGDVDSDDLRRLGIDDTVSPEEINQYLEDDDLNELVKIVGVQRDTGERATVQLKIFSTEDREVVIPAGTSFGTQPESDGSFREFETVTETSIPQDVSSSDRQDVGQDNRGKFVEVEAEATEVGEEFNVPTGTINYLVDPPTGVSGVINESDATGGISAEDNDDVRERAKRALVESSQGGTIAGVGGFVQSTTDANDVVLDEFPDGNNINRPLISYPHVEVIVDGGEDSEILDAIREAQPAGVQHFLVRPDIFNIGLNLTVRGTDIDNGLLLEDIESLYTGLDIGEDVFRDRTIQTILNADDDIESIETLDILVQDETFDVSTTTDTFSFDSNQLQYDVSGNLGVVVGVSDSSQVYTLGIDFTVTSTGIEWIDDGSSTLPTDGTQFEVVYIDHPTVTTDRVYNPEKNQYIIEPFDSVVSISDENETYVEGTDYEVTDFGISWLDGGTAPIENDTFTIELVAARSTYRVRKTAELSDITKVAISNPDETELVENTDWTQYQYGIELQDGVDIPSGETVLLVTYDVTEDIVLNGREKATYGTTNLTVSN